MNTLHIFQLKPHRKRIYYFLFVLVIMFLGLMSRKFASHLPEAVNAVLGDGLWALMNAGIFAFLFANQSTGRVALWSLLFCYAIECSQLYHAPWIDQLRHTTLGGLVLGFGFLWSDLGAYTVGVLVGVLLEWGVRKVQ